MENKALQTINVIRWIARILSVLFIGFFFLIFIGGSMQSVSSDPISSYDVLHLTLMGLVMLGLLAAWIWEMYGGLLAFLACIGLLIIHPSLITSPILFYLINAILFMLIWWLKFRQRNMEPDSLVS